MRFKFLRDNYIVDWRQTGLLDECNDEQLMIRVFNITRDYIMDNDLIENEIVVIIFPIIRRLYHNKRLSYTDEQISQNVSEIMEFLNSDDLRRGVRSILADAFMTVDVEAEITQLVTEHFNWNEEL